MFRTGFVGRQIIAGPTPQPAFNVSFAGPTLDPRFTFTRSGSATYYDASGVMQIAGPNTPRFDYGPIPGAEPLGLLIELTRTNILLNSSLLTGFSVADVTKTASSGVAPDGTNTMVRVAEAATGAVHFLDSGGMAVSAASVYAFSIFAKAQEVRYLQLFYDDLTNGIHATFDLVSGVISQAVATHGAGATATTASIQALSNGIYRLSISGTAAAAATARCGVVLSQTATPGFAPSYVGNTANGLLCWGAQLEQVVAAIPYSSSYIPTAGSALMRDLDICTASTAGWYNSTAGTLQAEWVVINRASAGAGTSACIWCVDDGSTNNTLVLRLQPATNNVGYTFVGGSNNFAATANSWTQSVVSKTAAAYTGTRIAACLNGGTVAVQAHALGMPTGINRVQIGNGRLHTLDGYVRSIKYWGQSLSNGQLQTVTK